MASPFTTQLAGVAEAQYTQFHLLNEADPVLCQQIKKYWADLGLEFTSCVTVPWSAVFVSWCVKQAGATAVEFKFAAAHSVFVFSAIQNAVNGTGVFRAVDITAEAPAIGDIIQNNRSGQAFDYNFAKQNKNYESHSAIVVETGHDANGPYALTIGGNEGNSVHQTRVPLTAEGFIVQRPNNPFICLIKDLK